MPVRIDEGFEVDIATDSIASQEHQLVKLEYGDAGSAVMVSNANPFPVGYGDSASLDAFARLRVSSPVGLGDFSHEYDLSPILWETATTGTASATHLPDESSVELSVDANGTVIRQTRQYVRYQPGKSQLIVLTFADMTLDAEATKRLGYYDDDNGIFLEVTDGASIVRRTFATGVAVDNPVAQASWNIDPFDGSGPSGITLDFTTSQIFFIDLEWLGVGRVRTGFFIDGVPYLAHEFLNTNVLDVVYMSTANLPIRYESAGGAGLVGSNTFKQICASVSSEGGIELERGYVFTANNGITSISVTTRRPIISIRPRLTFNSLTNRILAILEDFFLYTEDQAAFVELVYGGTLTNASFSNVNTTYSSVERDVAATAIAGGISIASYYVPASPAQGAFSGIKGTTLLELSTRYPLALNIAGAHPTTPLTDSLSIVVTSINGSATDCLAGFVWREVR